MSEFKVGDKVILKSGGPEMVIKGIGDYTIYKDAILCTWFDRTGIHEEVFVRETLKFFVEIHAHPHSVLPPRRNPISPRKGGEV
jgi:uncharacterized protein YodC (DUF2158 family)